MREIIFKGYNIDNAQWHYGNLEESINKLTNGDFARFYYISDKSDVKSKYFLVEDDSIGQYTGLDDKKGERIFERDILEYYGGKGVVIFRFGCWHIIIGDVLIELGEIYDSCEVTGNEYEEKLRKEI